jgi:hypothetical protein
MMRNEVTQNSTQWWAYVNNVMNLSHSLKLEEFS